jgi:uncharacterized protein (TIGR03435 family)
LILLAIASHVFAQTTPAALKFEAASIKPSPPESRPSMGCHAVDLPRTTIGLGRCVFHHATLRDIISQAYPPENGALRPPERITGGPGWIEGSVFDIEAEAPDPAKANITQLREMLQTLLKDRFHLVLHRERRAFSGYYMVEAKDGFKLKEAAGPLTPAQVSAAKAPGSHPLFANNMPLPWFADLLSVMLKEPIVDKTGIPGKYNYFLNSAETGDELAGSVFTAIQEQLGLKLEAAKIPFDILVIDSVERPTPN